MDLSYIPSEWGQSFLLSIYTQSNGVHVPHAYVDINDGYDSDAKLFAQILYWFLPNRETGKRKVTQFYDGYWWIAKNHKDWYKEARLRSNSVRRMLTRLHDRDLIVYELRGFAGQKTPHIRINWKTFEKRMKDWQKYEVFFDEEPPTGSWKFKERIAQFAQKDQGVMGEQKDQGCDLKDQGDCAKRSSISRKKIESNTKITTKTTTESTTEHTETSDDVSSEDLRPPIFEAPHRYKVSEIQKAKLFDNQWRSLLENEQAGRSKYGVRSSVIAHCKQKLDMSPLDKLRAGIRAEMLDAMNEATIQDIGHPGMGGLFTKVFEQLVPSAEPGQYYTPKQVRQFARENKPVEQVHYLKTALSAWLGKKQKGQSSNGKPDGQPSKPARPNITIPGGHRDYDAEADALFARALEDLDRREREQAGQPAAADLP